MASLTTYLVLRVQVLPCTDIILQGRGPLTSGLADQDRPLKLHFGIYQGLLRASIFFFFFLPPKRHKQPTHTRETRLTPARIPRYYVTANLSSPTRRISQWFLLWCCLSSPRSLSLSLRASDRLGGPAWFHFILFLSFYGQPLFVLLVLLVPHPEI